MLPLAPTGGVDPNLTHMGISAVLMIRNNRNLQHERAKRLHIAILNGYLHPTIWLCKVDDLQLLEIVKVCPRSYGNAWWGVTLVQLVVCVYVDLADVGPLVKLYVNQVRQLPVGLPVGIHYVVPQTFHSESWKVELVYSTYTFLSSPYPSTWLTWGQAPNCLSTNFTDKPKSLFCKWILLVCRGCFCCGFLIYISRHSNDLGHATKVNKCEIICLASQIIQLVSNTGWAIVPLLLRSNCAHIRLTRNVVIFLYLKFHNTEYLLNLASLL